MLDVSLMEYIIKKGKPSEEYIQLMIEKLTQALKYLHSKGIIHRDLKLENIMIRNMKSGLPEPVLIDFGLAEFADAKQVNYSRCGTAGFIAPEVLNF